MCGVVQLQAFLEVWVETCMIQWNVLIALYSWMVVRRRAVQQLEANMPLILGVVIGEERAAEITDGPMPRNPAVYTSLTQLCARVLCSRRPIARHVPAAAEKAGGGWMVLTDLPCCGL